ncbi:hypothetical protein [Chromobacterium amazonense]|uniref:hypothetical protein n=1 Tax=Chromobacterium amazonense TaxID=1382803 RepID=UPI0011B1D0FA|nr:hypothetical protein [Chromobacterium amazonense]
MSRKNFRIIESEDGRSRKVKFFMDEDKTYAVSPQSKKRRSEYAIKEVIRMASTTLSISEIAQRAVYFDSQRGLHGRLEVKEIYAHLAQNQLINTNTENGKTANTERGPHAG